MPDTEPVSTYRELDVHLHRLARHRADRALRRAGRRRVPRPRARASRSSATGARSLIEGLRPAQADAARRNARSRSSATGMPTTVSATRRATASRAEVIFPTFALQACFASDDAGAPARAVPRVQQLGGRGVRRTTGCSRSAWCRCSTSTARSRRRRRRGRSGLPRAVPPGAGARSARTTTPAYDRFWAVAEELGLPLTFHSGTGHEPRVVRGPGGAVVNYLLGAQLDGPMVMLTLAAGGALDRFPGLQIVTVETGAAWLAWIMTQADAIYEDHSMFAPAEAVDEAERADPAPVRTPPSCTTRSRSTTARSPASRRSCGATTTRTPRAPGPRRRRSPRTSSTASPTTTCTPSSPGNAAGVFGFDLATLS